MNSSFYTSIEKEKENISNNLSSLSIKCSFLLKQKYPYLPNNIIDEVIETCFWQSLFGGPYRYKTQIASAHFYTMTCNIINEKCQNSFSVIKEIWLNTNRTVENNLEESQLVKGLRSIPEGILEIILESVYKLWTRT